MKKIALFVLCAVATLLFSSCGKINYKSFVGTWGVEKIEYYNIDYAGNPIAASMGTYVYDPNDIDNGIQLVFREDKTGEMRDNDVDTIPTNWNPETQTYESYIVNPDTTLLKHFTYSYDASSRILYMNIQETVRTYMMRITNFTDDSFIYENEYNNNYVEKAYMKRLSKSPDKSASRKAPQARPRKEGSFMSDK